MDTYDHVLRGVLTEPGAVNPERLRSLLLDSPASARRDRRAGVPAIVAAFEAGVTNLPEDDWTALHHRLAGRGDLTSDNIEIALASWARVLDRKRTNIDTPPRLPTDPRADPGADPSMPEGRDARDRTADEAVVTRRPFHAFGLLAALMSIICIVVFIGMAAGKLGNPAPAAWLAVPGIGLASGLVALVIRRSISSNTRRST